MKRDDLYIPARRLIHDHMLSTVLMSHVTSPKGAGSGGWPRPSIGAVDESAPVSQIRGDS